MGYREEKEERAAREAKRNAIRREISRLAQKISVARDIIEGLNECKRNITRGIEQWNEAYNAFNVVPINNQIFITDLFEGNIAETLSSEVPNTAGIMVNTCGQMESLCGYIADQISRLNEYISRLQTEIRELYVELAAI